MKILRNCRTSYVLNAKCERSHAKGGPTLFRALLKQRLVDQLNPHDRPLSLRPRKRPDARRFKPRFFTSECALLAHPHTRG